MSTALQGEKLKNQFKRDIGEYILGLDLGTGSIGWAIIALDKKGNPCKLELTGVHRFEAGVSGDITSGKDESRATARREARGPRRNNWRRQWRMRKLFRKLQHFGLLPPSDDDSPDQRHQLILDLDQQLMEQYLPDGDRAQNHLLPYLLRAKGLDETLPAHAVGRAIYQLAQRRGFLSNRKTSPGDGEETGVVKEGIAQLDQEIQAANCRTIGEYFATLDPEEARIRSRWTARRMFDEEFEKIWAAQSPHHKTMTAEAKEQIKAAIFDQRKLKSQKHLIGRCEHHPSKRGAPLACLLAQQFRLWQRLNDLRVTAPNGSERELTLEEKNKLHQELEGKAELTWARIKTILGLKKSKEYGRHWVFNFEEGGEKKMFGNRTAAKLVKVIENTWKTLEPERKEILVDEILSFESEEALARRLEKAWGISSSDAKAVADLRFEEDYARISRKAIRELLPLMQQGMAYSTAVKKMGYAEIAPAQAATIFNTLPPIQRSQNDANGAFPPLRNPTVERALTELRKVVNAMIRRYGKPAKIHVELARDLKHSRKHRKDITERRNKNTSIREKAKERILQEMGSDHYVNDANILKIRLADECNWECPYTGKPIGMKALVGDEPQFDIEHILPFSQSLDNSYLNKTLCDSKENREVKKNQTPYQAYYPSEKYAQIIDRVSKFQGDARGRKLRLFQAEKLPDADDFSQKQLSDTRYISRKAAEYLALLYGGKIDSEGKMRIQVSAGRATAYLRQRWNLNSIIGHDEINEKNRADHRHHAIDAIVIALINPKAIQLLARAAEQAEERGDTRLFADVDPPWKEYLTEARESILAINVSSRVSKKLNGSLHKGTIFSKPMIETDEKGEEVEVHHVRKPLSGMSSKEAEAIVDPVVRRLVKEKLAAHSGPPNKVFNDPANLPCFISKKDPNRVIPIRSARIRKSDNPIIVGSGTSKRYVNAGSNHHMEIIAHLDANGKDKKWTDQIVSRFEAMRRKRTGEPIIQKDHGPDKRLVFTLTGGEHIELTIEDAPPTIYRVQRISKNKMECILLSDARPFSVRSKLKGVRVSCTMSKLKKSNARKVTISPLGEVFPAND